MEGGAPAIGTTLQDRYVVTGELGRGGMGVVYRARDPVLDREVAIKLIPPSHVTPEAEERFRREAQLVAGMDHPGIVPIYDFGHCGESLFLVMPVVEGASLRPFLRDKALVLGDVLDVGIAVADALQHSHGRGVVHRDIKPENIMVTRDEGRHLRVRVMDFGLAKVSTKTRLTQTGVLVGTMAYISPEQITGGTIDHRTDLYALGTVLYECLVGRPPFSGEVQSILYRIVHEHAEPPSSLGVKIDPELEGIVQACLAKDPKERPKSAGHVGDALRRYRGRLRDSDHQQSVMLSDSALPRPVLAPFVGREREGAELQKRLNAALAGECQFVVVGGEAGIGKTRLLDELEGLARARGVRVLHGRFVEQDRSFPYQGFCEAIQEYFRQKETGSSSTVLPDFSDLAADLVALFPMLSEIGEIGSGAPVEANLPEDRTRIFELLARALMRVAAGRPLVLLLEDLHDADVSLEALQFIVRRLGPTPTLIVGTYRTTGIDRRHPLSRMLHTFQGDRRFVSILLGAFSPSEHRQFLESLVGARELADDLVRKIYDGTEGNPFFTKELVRSLLDAGAIDKDETGTWSLSGQAAITTDALPATIQQAVENRIERLAEGPRELLSIASVLGRSFDFRDLETLAGDTGDVEGATELLVREGLLEEERASRGDQLTFANAIVRDVLYAQLPRRRRRSLHRRCAKQLESRMAGRLERVYPELLYHFSEGDVPEKTVEYGLLHARHSLDAFTPEEAVRAARTALEFIDEEWEGERVAEGEARLLLARALRMGGDIDAALRQAEGAVRVFAGERLAKRTVEALLFAAETAWQARRTGEMHHFVERGLAAARAAGETEGLKEFLGLGATLANLRGAYDRANELLREAERLGASGAAEVEREVPSGGRLVVSLANPVNARAPPDSDTYDEAEVLANVFETLLVTDAEGNLVPALCETWRLLDQGRSLLLKLRDDVRFQDGHALAAADVKRSFEWTIRRDPEKLPAAFGTLEGVEDFLGGRAEGVAGLVARTERELEIRLADPLPIYPAFLTDPRTAIVREGAGRLVGTGPFVLSTQEAGRIVLERSEAYWKGGPARLERVEFRPGMSAPDIAEGLRSGELDLASDLQPQDLEEILRDPRFRRGYVEAPKKSTYFALFNSLTSPAGRNADFRRALCGVVRTTDLVWQTLGRFGQPATCLIPPGILGHDPGRRHRLLGRDEARALLESTGVDLPVRLHAAVHPLLRDRCGSLLKALFSLWSEIGVKVEVKSCDMRSFLETCEKSDGIDLLISRWIADYDDPDNFTYSLFHSKVRALRTYFSAPETDALLEEARAEARAATRRGLYRKFEGEIVEADILLPLFHDIDYRIASPKVRGVKLGQVPPRVNYAQIGIGDEPAPAPAASPAGVIHVPVAGAVTALEPWRVSTGEQAEVLPCVFESLMHQQGARVTPGLAERYTVERGGTQLKFRLRDDVHFHDGRRLTARDVRYSYERLLQEWEFRGLLAPIRGAQALLAGESCELEGFRIHSATEFTIELVRPVSFFPVLLSDCIAGVVPEGCERFGASWQEGFVGTGPFRVVNFEPGRRLELERNPHYWRKGYPRSDRLVFSFGVAPEAILNDFRSGRFSLCSDLFPADVAALRRDSAYASGYRETPHLSTFFLACNVRQGPLKDPEMRRRLLRAIRVARLVRETLGSLAIPANGFIPPGLLGHEPTAARAPAAAGESLGSLELTAALHTVFDGKYSGVARRVLDSLRAAGVRVKRTNETMEEFLAAVDSASVDLLLGRWIADYPDSDTFAYGALHSHGGKFGKFCGSTEIDRLADRARAEADPAARHSLYRQIEEIIARDALLLPLFHEQVYRFARPELAGLTVSYGHPVVRYDELSTRA